MGDDKNKKEIKLLVYLEDGREIDKHAIILSRDSIGVNVQLFDITLKKEIGVAFFLPWDKVAKIKNLKDAEMQELKQAGILLKEDNHGK